MVLCMVPLMPTVMTIGSRIVHPCCICVVCRMSYFSSVLVVVVWGDLSLHYLNSMKCTFKLGSGIYEGGLVGGCCAKNA